MSGGGMSGAQGPGLPDISGAVGANQSIGLSGSGINAVNAAAMPAWQRGLLAAMTGNQQFGQNAPQINQLVKSGVAQMGQPPQQQGAAGAPMQRRPMMPGQAPQMGAGSTQPLGGGNVPQMPAPFAQQLQQNPQMMAQLQANPAVMQQLQQMMQAQGGGSGSMAPWMQRPAGM